VDNLTGGTLLLAFTLTRVGLYESGYPCVGYSEHEFARIPMAASRSR